MPTIQGLACPHLAVLAARCDVDDFADLGDDLDFVAAFEAGR